MFSRVAKGGFQKIQKRLLSDSSHSDFEAWNAAYKNMRNEAREIAELAVGGTKSEVSSLRSEMRVEIASVKSDVHTLKSDVHGLVQGQVELHKQISSVHEKISNLHNQGVNQTRLLLAGGTAIAGAFFAANQYVEHLKESKKQPVLK